MPALRCLVLLFALSLLAEATDPTRIVSRMEERPVLVRLPDRTLAGWFTREISGSDQNAYHGQRIDLWHLKTAGGRKQWEAPKQIWTGYTGAMNPVEQMRNGRIVFPFSYYSGVIAQNADFLISCYHPGAVADSQ